MIQPISADKLVVDTKYMILFKQSFYSGIFKGVLPGFDIFVFDKMYDLVCEERRGRPAYLSDVLYCEFISDQPQWKMARRSVNIIVRKLIGDNHFEW